MCVCAVVHNCLLPNPSIHQSWFAIWVCRSGKQKNPCPRGMLLCCGPCVHVCGGGHGDEHVIFLVSTKKEHNCHHWQLRTEGNGVTGVMIVARRYVETDKWLCDAVEAFHGSTNHKPPWTRYNWIQTLTRSRMRRLTKTCCCCFLCNLC